MASWWNSLEAVSRFSLAVKWVAALGSIVAAVSGVLVIVSTKRIDSLREARESLNLQQARHTEQELQERLKAAEKQLQDRHLTAEEQSRFIEILKSGPKGQLTIWWQSGVPEAGRFAQKLGDLIKAGGWQVSVMEMGMVTVVGLELEARTPDRPSRSGGAIEMSGPPGADELINAFKVVGLSVALHAVPNVAPDCLRLRVGSKP